MKRLALILPLLISAENFNDIAKSITNSLNYKLAKKDVEIYEKRLKAVQAKNYGKLITIRDPKLPSSVLVSHRKGVFIVIIINTAAIIKVKATIFIYFFLLPSISCKISKIFTSLKKSFKNSISLSVNILKFFLRDEKSILFIFLYYNL
jgi:hypothetical protein